MPPEEMIEAINELDREPLSERRRDAPINSLIAAAPHARISDLIYYPDQDRTPEEIVNEALRRENEWRAGNPE